MFLGKQLAGRMFRIDLIVEVEELVVAEVVFVVVVTVVVVVVVVVAVVVAIAY